MKYAKSIYLGGELVNPQDCSYSSYAELGLVCPVCGAAVHLVNGSVVQPHQRKGKTIKGHQREIYFSHFDKGIYDEACSNKSDYSKQNIEAINTLARQQRLSLFNKKFEEIIYLATDNFDFLSLATNRVFVLLLEYNQNETFASACIEGYQRNLYKYFKNNSNIVDDIKCETDINTKISKEAFKYLSSDTGNEILAKMFWQYLLEYSSSQEPLGQILSCIPQSKVEEMFSLFSKQIIAFLSEINWSKVLWKINQ